MIFFSLSCLLSVSRLCVEACGLENGRGLREVYVLNWLRPLVVERVYISGSDGGMAIYAIHRTFYAFNSSRYARSCELLPGE